MSWRRSIHVSSEFRIFATNGDSHLFINSISRSKRPRAAASLANDALSARRGLFFVPVGHAAQTDPCPPPPIRLPSRQPPNCESAISISTAFMDVMLQARRYVHKVLASPSSER